MKLKELHDKRLRLIKEQREINDRTLKEEREFTADEETKYEALEKDLAETSKKIKRLEDLERVENSLRESDDERLRQTPKNGGSEEEREKEKREAYHHAFFNGYMRRGDDRMSPEFRNALEAGTDAEGGYLVPEEWARDLIRAVSEVNVVRMAGARSIVTSSLRNLPVRASRATFTWIDEEGAYSTNDPSYGNLQISANKLGGIILVSEELLQDNAYDLPGQLGFDAVEEKAYQEEVAFVNGNGTLKPLGLFATTAVASVNLTGTTAASTSTVTADELIDSFYGLGQQYRRRASWITGTAMTKIIRKLKDGDNQYLWQPGLATGQPDRLLGQPFFESHSAPAIAADARTIMFGDFGYYLIGDRLAMVMQRLNELYAANGQVGFKFHSRVDGKLTLAPAFTFLKQAAA